MKMKHETWIMRSSMSVRVSLIAPGAAWRINEDCSICFLQFLGLDASHEEPPGPAASQGGAPKTPPGPPRAPPMTRVPGDLWGTSTANVPILSRMRPRELPMNRRYKDLSNPILFPSFWIWIASLSNVSQWLFVGKFVTFEYKDYIMVCIRDHLWQCSVECNFTLVHWWLIWGLRFSKIDLFRLMSWRSSSSFLLLNKTEFWNLDAIWKLYDLSMWLMKHHCFS